MPVAMQSNVSAGMPIIAAAHKTISYGTGTLAPKGIATASTTIIHPPVNISTLTTTVVAVKITTALPTVPTIAPAVNPMAVKPTRYALFATIASDTFVSMSLTARECEKVDHTVTFIITIISIVPWY